jgi:aspartate aminotransferase-like enzyme
MGNIGAGEVAFALCVIEESLRAVGLSVEPGTALSAASRHLAG